MKLGIKLATLASAIAVPVLSYGIYALTNGTTADNNQDTITGSKEEIIALPPVDTKPPEPPKELEKVPQVGQASSHETDEEKKQKEIEEGKKEFENFTKTGNMPSQVRKIRLYFKSKGGPDNPGAKYRTDIYGGCYHFNSGCPLGYYGMNNIYGGNNIRWEQLPHGFKG